VTHAGERLRLARIEKEMTLREVEEMTGLSKDTISRVERGLREPLPLTVAKLARAYGHAAEDFLEGLSTPKVQAPPSPGPEPQRAAEGRGRRAEVESFITEAEEVLDDPDLVRDVCLGMLENGGIFFARVRQERFTADPRISKRGHTWREFNDLAVAEQSMERFLKKAQMVYRNKFGKPDQETEKMLKALPGGLDEEAG
jgi:transcriptional regulator with XRE-family HTH domain